MLGDARLDSLDITSSEASGCSLVLGAGEPRTDLDIVSMLSPTLELLCTYRTLESRDRGVGTHLSLARSFVDCSGGHCVWWGSRRRGNKNVGKTLTTGKGGSAAREHE
jgi:hypothetical protein